MSEAPKLKRPMGGMPIYEPLYLQNGIRTTVGELTLLELNFGISKDQADAMEKDEFYAWQIKLSWLSQQGDGGFSRYDVCKSLYGLSFQQIIAMPPEELFPIYKPVEVEWRKVR